MSNKINVMVFPAGAENAIDIYASLKYNIHFNVFGASAKKDHAEYIYPKDRYILDDLYINKGGFLTKLNNIIFKYNIEYILPTHDIIASFLMEHLEEIGARIVCSPFETTRIAMNKRLTYEELKGYDFLPKVYETINDVNEYPVFVKPHVSAGGKGASLISTHEELQDILDKHSDMVICDYLSGQEYTVDCFTNRNGELLFVGPRTRERITAGITFHSEGVENKSKFMRIANVLNGKFKFRGAWFFQVKEDCTGALKLMEFSVRQAGTMAFYRQMGVNFAALSLFDAMGLDVDILINNHKISLDRYIESSYHLDYVYEKLYIDLDDTLIVQSQVNTQLIKLIYQSIHLGRKVILITKHEKDLDYTLKQYRINKELFDEIFLLDHSQNKWDYIDHDKAIFIDNYFPDRNMVKKVCNIPVFDVDAVNCLVRAEML